MRQHHDALPDVRLGGDAGGDSSGLDILNLEFCTESGNASDGLNGKSANASSRVRYPNCVSANSGSYGVERANTGTIESRGNDKITVPASTGLYRQSLPRHIVVNLNAAH